MSSFETDVMEDLYYDEAEGPARQQFDEYDEFGEEEGDEFLRTIIGGLGRAVGGLIGGGEGFDEYDEFDEYDAYDTDEYEDMDAMMPWKRPLSMPWQRKIPMSFSAVYGGA